MARQRSDIAEPDWSNIHAVRIWLESRYPIGNGQILSPFYQYLKDEQAKGNKIRGRETHLSRGPGGEFSKWVFENTEGDNAFYYPESSMRVTYYPEYANRPTPDSDEDKFFTPPPTPSNPKTPRRKKQPKTLAEPLKTEERRRLRLRTLRPRHNGKVRKIK